MTALLWVMAVFYGLNTLSPAVLMLLGKPLPPVTAATRFIDWALTAVLWVWAVCLLAVGGS